jgi:acyl-CoA synthetase (AMP-forming)/AMP-acid ligase II
MISACHDDMPSARTGDSEPGSGTAPGTVAHLIHAWAEETPDEIAIGAPGCEPITYAELWTQVRATLAALNSLGIGPGDRVAMVLPNGPDLAVAFLSVSSGATSVPLNPSYALDEFLFSLSDLKAKAVMVPAGTESPARLAAQQLGIEVLELAAAMGPAGTFRLAGSAASTPVVESFSRPDDVALVLHTSGTTSRPKIVPLTQSNLCTSARNLAQSVDLSRADRCLCVMPLFHVHGLIGSLLSSVTAGAVVFCPPSFLAPKFFHWMEECRPSWYSAVPTMHLAILERARAHHATIDRCPLRFLRSCSASLSVRLMAELEAAFGAPVIQAYGMTEASHQIASNPLPPGKRKPGSVGVSTGSEVAILDDEGSPLPAGQVGEIALRGGGLFRGYEGNLIANEAAFTRGWFRTGDQGYLDTEGYLFITGRLKEIINRGGEKISPQEIDEVLADHPAVARAVTFPLPHPTLGEEVAAAVVLGRNACATEREIREFAAARLADFKVPCRIVFVEEIPLGPTGKVRRVGLAESLGQTTEANSLEEMDRAYVPPATALEKTLAAIWVEVLGLEQVGIHDDFLALGGDSVLATLVIARIREALGMEVSFLDFFEASTIARLAAVVSRDGTDQ